LLGLFLLAGCRVVEDTARVPGKAVSAIIPGDKHPQVDPSEFQGRLLRYAEGFILRNAKAADEYARRAGTPQARYQALKWEVALGSAAVSIASGPDPIADLLDLISLATLTRAVLQQTSTNSLDAAVFQGWLQTSRALETNAWELAGSVFKPEQQAELRAVLQRWYQANPELRGDFMVRALSLATEVKRLGQERQETGSVFGLIGLDPMAGLDPAVREITRTRLFAERALFTMQQMPLLLRWQTELLGDQLTKQPEIAQTLTNATRLAGSMDRISHAAESVSHTAAALPDQISTERKAIFSALETQEGKLRDLASEVRLTLSAGSQMSTSLNTSITSFDALMKRFGVGEPQTNAPPDTNSPPFNILDYARTAEQIAVMSRELHLLIKDTGATIDSPALHKRIQELDAISKRAQAEARSLLNHAALLGGGLVLLAFLCAILYRRLAPKATGTR
jgi:hypothetical protein